MEYNKVLDVVTSPSMERYKVKLVGGGTRVVRMFRFVQNGVPRIAVAVKGSRRQGFPMDTDGFFCRDWQSVKPAASEVDYVKRVVSRAKKASKMLEKSGLWASIKVQIDEFLSLPSGEIEEFVEAARTDFYENVYCALEKGKFGWCRTYQVFSSFLSEKCWKSPKFSSNRYGKEALAVAIADGRDFNYAWRDGYDNSVEVRFSDSDGEAKGWYSEEYKGCGNGHYYLLFDADHAIFYEDD